MERKTRVRLRAGDISDMIKCGTHTRAELLALELIIIKSLTNCLTVYISLLGFGYLWRKGWSELRYRSNG